MFHGHLIGAVIARDRETARKASKLVNIEYQDLEAIFTLEVRYFIQSTLIQMLT